MITSNLLYNKLVTIILIVLVVTSSIPTPVWAFWDQPLFGVQLTYTGSTLIELGSTLLPDDNQGLDL